MLWPSAWNGFGSRFFNYTDGLSAIAKVRHFSRWWESLWDRIVGRMTDERLLRLLGLRVKQLRMQRNLTQEGMSKFGFEIKYYQKLEYGQKNISVKTLHRLAKAFDVPVSELFRFDRLSARHL